MADAKDSAKSGDSAQTWSGLISELQKSFNLLRDVFGYAMPGAVFLSIGLMSGRIKVRQVSELLAPLTVPTWAIVALLIIVCYVVGQVLAAVAYTPSNILKALWAKKHPAWVKKQYTEVSPELLEVQRHYPGFLLTLDRRETIGIFIGSTMVALLGGTAVFYLHWFTLPRALLLGGLILLVDFWTVFSHLGRVRTAIEAASKLAAEYDEKRSKGEGGGKTDEIKHALLDLIKSATDATSGL